MAVLTLDQAKMLADYLQAELRGRPDPDTKRDKWVTSFPTMPEISDSSSVRRVTIRCYPVDKAIVDMVFAGVVAKFMPEEVPDSNFSRPASSTRALPRSLSS